MKIRQGFVSNSSSSSFIVAYKGAKPTVAQMMESFGIAKGSPASELFGGIFENLLSAKCMTKEDIKDRRGDDPEDEVVKLIDDGWAVLEGYASDEDSDPDEFFLCFSDIDISTDTLVIKKESGY